MNIHRNEASQRNDITTPPTDDLRQLMAEIDERVQRFCTITGANGKPVAKRWRDIKKSSHVPLPQPQGDRLAALEIAVRDFFITKGYIPSADTWEFEVTIISRRKNKHMMILFGCDEMEKDEDFALIYQAETTTLDALYDDAFDYFRSGGQDV